MTKFKETEKERIAFKVKMSEKEKERLNEIYSKTHIDPKALPLPLPADIITFERLAKESEIEKKQNSRKKSLGFGVGPRIPLNDKEKWMTKVNRYNTFAATKIDPKADPLPGPSTYSLISHWADRKLIQSQEKSKDTTKPINFLQKISKGPVFSPYYSKIN